MVSVPKRLHKRANVRNLLKRRMREAVPTEQRALT
ncbi:MAG: ribonuclease P protein component [Alistipes indistinctus]